MEVALVSAATGALKPVLEKLATLLGDEYKRVKSVHKEIKCLTDELTFMHAFLLEMSEDEDPGKLDKVWMTAVRELSYDMEDSIDDFMQNIDDKDVKPEGFIEKIKHSLGKLGKMKARRRIGKEIQDLKKQVIKVGDRNARYKSREVFSNIRNSAVDPRALAIYEDASNLVGIDQPKAEVIKLLTKESGCGSTQEQPKIVSIVGSGGMGKTTLANQVYQQLKEKFQCQAFVSVSRNPNMTNILRTILSEVAKKDYANTEAGSIQQLVSNISNFLVDKSYFIVIDDIWKKETWDVIKYAFPMTSCGIIITTTRMKDVAHSCQASFGGHVYNVRPLNIVHSRQLFHGRLFNSEAKCPPFLREVSDQILRKCDGLPLAIIAISGLLANKERTMDQWNEVKDSIGRALERNSSIESMMKILSLSYFDLPPHLKTCLLYVSIFPEDSFIEKNDLIRRWIAEAFIHKEGRYTIHEIGERCFNELLNRGLIQSGKTNEYGEVKSCRVHDTILDFVISKSIEENFVSILGVPILKTETQSNVIRRFSLQGVKEGNSTKLKAGLMLSHVRSLNVFGGLVEIPSLEEFKHLRVLDLSNQPLEEHHLENIMRLFQLRYLNLEKTGVSMLPEQIGHLGCLEMLNLRSNILKKLPSSIVNLGKLSHVLVDDCVKFPPGIGKMQALEVLGNIRLSIQPFDFLWGLGQLKNLRDLFLDFYFKVDSGIEDTNVVGEECSKAIVSHLCKLGTENLHSLTIRYGSNLLQEPLCLLTLKKLIARSSAVPQVPRWISSLRNLQQLRLQVEGINQVDLCILGGLSSLLILHLKEVTKSNERLRINGEIGFQLLRIFIYDANHHPVDLMFTERSMPKLEILELHSLCVVEAEPPCLDFDLMFVARSVPKILELDPLHGVEAQSLDFGIKNLPCLISIRCQVEGDDGIVEAVKTAMEREVNAHANHPGLLFKRTIRTLGAQYSSSDDELY